MAESANDERVSNLDLLKNSLFLRQACVDTGTVHVVVDKKNSKPLEQRISYKTECSSKTLEKCVKKLVVKEKEVCQERLKTLSKDSEAYKKEQIKMEKVLTEMASVSVDIVTQAKKSDVMLKKDVVPSKKKTTFVLFDDDSKTDENKKDESDDDESSASSLAEFFDTEIGLSKKDLAKIFVEQLKEKSKDIRDGEEKENDMEDPVIIKDMDPVPAKGEKWSLKMSSKLGGVNVQNTYKSLTDGNIKTNSATLRGFDILSSKQYIMAVFPNVVEAKSVTLGHPYDKTWWWQYKKEETNGYKIQYKDLKSEKWIDILTVSGIEKGESKIFSFEPKTFVNIRLYRKERGTVATAHFVIK